MPAKPPAAVTLLVVPVFYLLIDDGADLVKRAFRRIFGGGAGEAQEKTAHPQGA